MSRYQIDGRFSAGLAYYTEYLAMFPFRAGGDVAYLEQVYKRPKFMRVHLYISIESSQLSRQVFCSIRRRHCYSRIREL
ncbi:hypothetical protein C8R44DRAFT_788719 [Mycena epipterygia]|nr:hypothetical protein C8R44DRAFT_788719 [Mycena epipterygia]